MRWILIVVCCFMLSFTVGCKFGTMENPRLVKTEILDMSGHTVHYYFSGKRAAATHITTKCAHEDCKKIQKMLENN
jgi:hypothetical protein